MTDIDSSPSQDLIEGFPENMALPEPLIAFFQWAEEQDLYENWYDEDAYSYMHIDPSCRENNSNICIELPDPENTEGWTQSNDPAINDRLALFCRTGGDGSYAGLWQDDTGKIHFVHLGSGSGSIALGIMTSDAIDFLRLLAIGFDELCWIEDHELTVEEIAARELEDDEDFEPSGPPEALRQWLLERYGVAPPARPIDIIGRLRQMGEPHDAFSLWLETVSGEDDE